MQRHSIWLSSTSVDVEAWLALILYLSILSISQNPILMVSLVYRSFSRLRSTSMGSILTVSIWWLIIICNSSWWLLIRYQLPSKSKGIHIVAASTLNTFLIVQISFRSVCFIASSWLKCIKIGWRLCLSLCHLSWLFNKLLLSNFIVQLELIVCLWLCSSLIETSTTSELISVKSTALNETIRWTGCLGVWYKTAWFLSIL